jgi:hypothetical protein
MLNITHNAGFFSCSTVALNRIIEYHNSFNSLPITNRNQQYSLYKDKDDDDISNFFIENVDELNIEPSFLVRSDIEDQFVDYSLINYDYVTKLVNMYFKPTSEVYEIMNRITDKYNIDTSKTISILYRGNDKSRETILPSYEEMLDKINEVINENPNHKILVQTDEIDFSEFISSKIDVIVIKESKMIKKGNTAIQYKTEIGEKVSNAKIFLAIMNLISRCDKVILNSGNVGLWTCLYRGNNNGVYQFISRGLISNDITNSQKNRWNK